MSDGEVKSECAVTPLYLRKPISYYPDKFAIDKTLFMLSELEHRGQDSGGISCVNVNARNGSEYMWTVTGPNSTENLKLKLVDVKDESLFNSRLVGGQRRYTTFASKAGEQPMERSHPKPTKRFSV